MAVHIGKDGVIRPLEQAIREGHFGSGKPLPDKYTGPDLSGAALAEHQARVKFRDLNTGRAPSHMFKGIKDANPNNQS